MSSGRRRVPQRDCGREKSGFHSTRPQDFPFKKRAPASPRVTRSGRVSRDNEYSNVTRRGVSDETSLT